VVIAELPRQGQPRQVLDHPGPAGKPGKSAPFFRFNGQALLPRQAGSCRSSGSSGATHLVNKCRIASIIALGMRAKTGRVQDERPRGRLIVHFIQQAAGRRLDFQYVAASSSIQGIAKRLERPGYCRKRPGGGVVWADVVVFHHIQDRRLPKEKPN